MRHRFFLLGFLLLFWLPAASAQTLTVHSSLPEDITTALTKAFSQETGVDVTVIKENTSRTVEKIGNRADFSGDLVLTGNVLSLINMAESGFLLPQSASRLFPGYLTGPDGLWQAISARARLIIYHEALSRDQAFHSYRDLANVALQGNICISSAGQPGNVTLVANSVARMGRRTAVSWLEGMVANYAIQPFGTDYDQLQALQNGECGISLIASDVYLRLVNSPLAGERALVEGLGVVLPDQPNLDYTYAAILASSQNIALATRFMDFLASETAQRLLARTHYQYPVIADYQDEPVMAAFDKPVSLSANSFPADRQAYAAAIALLAEMGWQ